MYTPLVCHRVWPARSAMECAPMRNSILTALSASLLVATAASAASAPAGAPAGAPLPALPATGFKAGLSDAQIEKLAGGTLFWGPNITRF
mgnify:CR=1 FL=1